MQQKLRPGGGPASRDAVPGPDPKGVQEGHTARQVSCDCGWEGHTSAPKGQRFPGRWECPGCGAVWAGEEGEQQ